MTSEWADAMLLSHDGPQPIPKSSMKDASRLLLLKSMTCMLAAVPHNLIIIIHQDAFIFVHEILLSPLSCPCT